MNLLVYREEPESIFVVVRTCAPDSWLELYNVFVYYGSEIVRLPVRRGWLFTNKENLRTFAVGTVADFDKFVATAKAVGIMLGIDEHDSGVHIPRHASIGDNRSDTELCFTEIPPEIREHRAADFVPHAKRENRSIVTTAHDTTPDINPLAITSPILKPSVEIPQVQRGTTQRVLAQSNRPSAPPRPATLDFGRNPATYAISSEPSGPRLRREKVF